MLPALRRHRRRIAIVVLLIAALATAIVKGLKRSGFRGPAPSRGTVRRVIDGDTLDLTNGARIRLLDIDTPEYVGQRPEMARRATDALDELVAHRAVRLEYGPRAKDRYGRFLAYVFVAAGRAEPVFVNLELVKLGLARAYAGGGHGRRYDEILTAEREASSAKRGIWAGSE